MILLVAEEAGRLHQGIFKISTIILDVSHEKNSVLVFHEILLYELFYSYVVSFPSLRYTFLSTFLKNGFVGLI
jgi:hypothetical protein